MTAVSRFVGVYESAMNGPRPLSSRLSLLGAAMLVAMSAVAAGRFSHFGSLRMLSGIDADAEVTFYLLCRNSESKPAN